MEHQNFNPVIEAVVSIRHLVISVSSNWTSMKTLGETLTLTMKEASDLIDINATKQNKEEWVTELTTYGQHLKQLKDIMSKAVAKIKNKQSDGLLHIWNTYPEHARNIELSYNRLIAIGYHILPEHDKKHWETLWTTILHTHKRIKQEAEACSIQLKLIETYAPKEIESLTKIILKHIPIKYTVKEAQQYNKEYILAYEELKKEASKKKNIWDKFLDILAGGIQQTPAQRVMMQRWVDGEKGDFI